MPRYLPRRRCALTRVVARSVLSLEPLEDRRLLAATYIEHAKVVAFDESFAETPQLNARFGSSLAADGEFLVVATSLTDHSGIANAGAAYVFQRDDAGTPTDFTDDAWTPLQRLTASDPVADGQFGSDVAISGDTIVVGSNRAAVSNVNVGAAYVFVWDGSEWTEEQKLVASDGTAGDYFGNSVAVSGDTVAVGSYADDAAGAASGSAYVYTRSVGVWTEQQKLVASDGMDGDLFGWSIAVDGDTIAVGSRQDDDGSEAGSAYVFDLDAESWLETQKLTASNATSSRYFGDSMSLAGEDLVIGTANRGFAYIFSRDSGLWAESQILTVAGSATLGLGASIEGDLITVGDDVGGGGAGSTHVFRRQAVVFRTHRFQSA